MYKCSRMSKNYSGLLQSLVIMRNYECHNDTKTQSSTTESVYIRSKVVISLYQSQRNPDVCKRGRGTREKLPPKNKTRGESKEQK